MSLSGSTTNAKYVKIVPASDIQGLKSQIYKLQDDLNTRIITEDKLQVLKNKILERQ